MPKVYIDRDSSTSYFLWDSEVLSILPQPEYLLTEVPQELVDKYMTYQKLSGEIFRELEELYKARIKR